jgi:hypothetical protein
LKPPDNVAAVHPLRVWYRRARDGFCVRDASSTGRHSFDRDAGFTASYMETLLMGPERIEVLSTRPRQLTVL